MSSFRDKVGDAWATESSKETVAGVDIEIRSMSVVDKSRLLKNASTDGLIDVEKWYPWVVLTCCFDPETGVRAFTEEDLEWVAAQDSDKIADLAQKCLGISGMGSKPVDEGKDGS